MHYLRFTIRCLLFFSCAFALYIVLQFGTLISFDLLGNKDSDPFSPVVFACGQLFSIGVAICIAYLISRLAFSEERRANDAGTAKERETGT